MSWRERAQKIEQPSTQQQATPARQSEPQSWRQRAQRVEAPATPTPAPNAGATFVESLDPQQREAFEALSPEAQGRVKIAGVQQAQTQGRGIAAEPDARQQVVEGLAGGIEEQISYIPTAPLRSAASGVMQSGTGAMSLMGRGAEAVGLLDAEGGDAMQRVGQAISQGTQMSNEEAWTPDIVLNSIEGASRSITDMFLAGGLGKAAGLTGKAGQFGSVVTGFTASEMDRAVTAGRDAGLTGGSLAAYVAGQGAIEAGITTAFQLAGLGGLESGARETLKAGFKNGMKQVARIMGKRSLAEIPEEVMVESASQVLDYVAGVDDSALLTPEELATTALTAVFSTGGMTGGQMADAQTRRVLAERMMRQMQGQQEGLIEDEVEAQTGQTDQQQEAITDPSRLLPAPPTAGEQAAQVEQEAAAAREQAQVQPGSGQAIVVDQQGRAMSPEQAQALEEAGVDFAQRQQQEAAQQPKALPAPTRRFDVGPTRLTQTDVVDRIMQITPMEDAADPAEAEAERAYFEGVIQNLQNAEDGFVEVNLPVDQVQTINEPDASTVDQYAEQDPAGAPAIVAGQLSGEGPGITAINGKHRVAAARQRGETTIRAMIPVADAQQAGLMPPEFEGTTDLRDPQAERRGEAPQGREDVDALIAAGDNEAAQQRIKELQAELRTDPLTGEGNKRKLDEAGEALENRANRRKSGQPVVYLDIDNLHTANEVLGHEAMDVKMKEMARIIREEAGAGATVTRQGGDEFAIVWEKGKSQREARRIAKRVQERVGREPLGPGVTLGLSTGVGVVKPGDSFSEAYTVAERQATQDKRDSKIARGEAAGREEAMEAVSQPLEGAPPPPAPSLTNDPQAEQKRRAHLKGIEQRRRQKQNKIFDEEAKRKAQQVAAKYQQDTGRGTTDPKPVLKVNVETALRVAMAYENAEHAPEDEQVRASYDAFKQETLDQFNALKAAGYTFDLAPVDRVAEMYPDVASVSKDLGENMHLTVNEDPGDMPADHPLNEVAPGAGGMTYNHVFRAVHGVLGHAQSGNQFDIRGEENAWRAHSAMYTEKARGALATETRAQSNWGGYGPYGQQNQEKIKVNDIGAVEFPNQKATLLPDTYWTPAGTNAITQPSPSVQPREGRVARKDARESMRSRVGRKFSVDTLDDLIAPISSRIRDIDAATFKRMKEMLFRMGRGEEQAIASFENAMKPLHAEVGNWNTAFGRRVSAALQTDREQAKALVTEESAEAIDRAGEILDGLRERLIEAGIPVNRVENFWPRVVTDIEGLYAYLGTDEKGEIDRAIATARNLKGTDLSHEEKIAVINQHFRGRGPVDPAKVGPRHTRARSIETVTGGMLDLYQNPTQAALSYIRDMNKAIERSKFFGRGEVTADNLGDSVGVYVAEAVDRGDITPKQQDQLDRLIRALFTGDMTRVGSATRTLKQLAYLSHLTNFKSALTQLADAAGNVYLNGPTAAIRGYGDALSKKGSARRMTMEELGLHDYGAEWDDLGRIAGLLDKSLRIHGFKRLDRLGKEALINGTKHRLRQAAARPDSRVAKELRRRWSDVFSDQQWSEIMHDVRRGEVTDNVRFLAFLNLANVQPADVSETPVGYANNSNIFGNTAVQSRIFYTLKTFMLKRLDFIRRETVGEWNKGNKKRAARNLAALWLLWSAFEIPVDLFKDFLRGKLRWRGLPDAAVDAMLGILGLNRYMLDEASEDPVTAIANFFTGGVGGGIVEDAISDLTQATTGESPSGFSATPGIRLIRHIPIFGDSLYYLSPFGEGYHITNSQDEKSAKEKFQQVRDQAADALRRGDTFEANVFLRMYNDNKHITGRKTNLTQRELQRALIRERDNPSDGG